MAKLQDDKVKKLVNSGNAEGFAPLHLAAAGGHAAICRLLIEAGARLDLKHMAEQQTALHLAARKAHKEVVKLLLDKADWTQRKLRDYFLRPLARLTNRVSPRGYQTYDWEE